MYVQSYLFQLVIYLSRHLLFIYNQFSISSRSINYKTHIFLIFLLILLIDILL